MKFPIVRVFTVSFFFFSCSDYSVEQILVEVPHNIEVPPEMVYIPQGEFIMGDPEQSRTRKGKKVHLKAFLIDRFEVSRGQFKKFQPERSIHPKKEKLPISHVDFFEAESYCKSLGKRLPTEQEWEKAARGTDGRRWPWRIYYDHPNNGFSGFLPEPVGKREEWISPYGLYGMGHNVWEWTADSYNYEGMPKADRNVFKVIRGGLLQTHLNIQFSPTWFRNFMRPEEKLNFIGFRCANNIPLDLFGK